MTPRHADFPVLSFDSCSVPSSSFVGPFTRTPLKKAVLNVFYPVATHVHLNLVSDGLSLHWRLSFAIELCLWHAPTLFDCLEVFAALVAWLSGGRSVSAPSFSSMQLFI